jgi:hypothetical protein
MADEFNAGDLRQLADDVDALEQAGGMAADATAADAIPNPCDVYRNSLRPALESVRSIVCNPLIKRIIGSRPCDVVTQAIQLLDRLCPQQSPA